MLELDRLRLMRWPRDMRSTNCIVRYVSVAIKGLHCTISAMTGILSQILTRTEQSRPLIANPACHWRRWKSRHTRLRREFAPAERRPKCPRPRGAGAADRRACRARCRRRGCTMTRSASATASATSWVISTVVKPCSRQMRSSSRCISHPRQRVERAERLVEQQHAGPADQRARERDALALAARQHGRPVVGPVGEPDIGERRRRGLAPAVGCGRCRHCRARAARAAAARPGTAAARSAAAPPPARRRSRSCRCSAGRARRSAAAAWTCRSRSGRRSRGTARPGSSRSSSDSTRLSPNDLDRPSSDTASPVRRPPSVARARRQSPRTGRGDRGARCVRCPGTHRHRAVAIAVAASLMCRFPRRDWLVGRVPGERPRSRSAA